LAGKWAAQSGAQRSYIAIYNGATAKPSAAYSGAECLFMIVMQGGIADCLDCGALKTTDIGDKDGDTFPEFWDAWGNPIGFILWAPAYKLSGKDILFFTSETLDSPTGQASVRPALGMRPLIYSAGPDGEYGLNRNDELATLSSPTDQNGANCGDWTLEPTKSAAAPDQKAADNITNLDLEPK
jgi:hypothetical protein